MKHKYISNSARRKLFLGVAAILLVIALITAGTLAWTSFSQQARNDVQGASNPGGRLHDDFDGDNKDVYVENFGTLDIFVRVRLDEYMELGAGAGLRDTDPGYNPGGLVKYNPLADVNDVTTWTTHIPPDGNPAGCGNEPGPGALKYHDYIQWSMGGEKVYMPTFNLDNASLDADVTGEATDAGTGGKNTAPDNGNPGAHDDWGAGDTCVMDEDLGGGDINAGKTHTAVMTLDATVVSMALWVGMGRPSGAFWVYDADGWAYWAQALKPGTATGLLLDAIRVVREPDTDWYYGINVVGQFATQGDWNDGLNGEPPAGFYDPANGAPVMAGSGAEYLLKQAAGLLPRVDSVAISPDPAPAFITGVTDRIAFNAVVAGSFLENGDGNDAVVWDISPGGHGGALVNGVLSGVTVPGTYTVTATSKDDPGQSASVTVTAE